MSVGAVELGMGLGGTELHGLSCVGKVVDIDGGGESSVKPILPAVPYTGRGESRG